MRMANATCPDCGTRGLDLVKGAGRSGVAIYGCAGCYAQFGLERGGTWTRQGYDEVGVAKASSERAVRISKALGGSGGVLDTSDVEEIDGGEVPSPFRSRADVEREVQRRYDLVEAAGKVAPGPLGPRTAVAQILGQQANPAVAALHPEYGPRHWSKMTLGYLRNLLPGDDAESAQLSKAADDETASLAKLQRIADSIRAENPRLSAAAAFGEAISKHHDLYAKYAASQRRQLGGI